MAYGPGFIDFFDMEAVDGKMGHVGNGVYVAPPACKYARPYKVVAEKMRDSAVKKRRRTSESIALVNQVPTTTLV